MSVRIGSLALDTPLMNGSGAVDITSIEPNWRFPIDALTGIGAYVTKTVTLHERVGNPHPRVALLNDGGALNAVGLGNPGIERALAEWPPYLRDLRVPIILNIAGTPEELAQIVENAAQTPWVAAFELNMSCPNVDQPIPDSTDIQATLTLVRECTDRPLLVKLSPAIDDIGLRAQTAEFHGADAIVAGNTRRVEVASYPEATLSMPHAGLSGPALHNLARACVEIVAWHVDIPIVGCGGISDEFTAQAMFDAGASAIAIGIAAHTNPCIFGEVAAQSRALSAAGR